MKHFMFGFDAADPRACAQGLKARGIDAVVAGGFSPSAAAAFQAENISLYLCYVAHSVSKETDAESRLSMNPDGEKRRWFSSACPNDWGVARERLQKTLAAAREIPGLQGVFVDGARFASFASPEGFDAFFTCFCPRCMEKMQQMGLDGEKIREAVKRLEKDQSILKADEPLFGDWLKFRESCVKAYMDQFALAIRAENRGWHSGAFIFAPSLGHFVGQTMAACASLDIVSPMLYRSYPHPHGPACLDHEWAAFHALLGEKAAPFRQLFSAMHAQKLAGTAEETAARLRKEGFSPQEVGIEVAAAKGKIRPGQWLAPIIQLEDASQQETARCALESGADGVGYFAYGQGELPPQIKNFD